MKEHFLNLLRTILAIFAGSFLFLNLYRLVSPFFQAPSLTILEALGISVLIAFTKGILKNEKTATVDLFVLGFQQTAIILGIGYIIFKSIQ